MNLNPNRSLSPRPRTTLGAFFLVLEEQKEEGKKLQLSQTLRPRLRMTLGIRGLQEGKEGKKIEPEPVRARFSTRNPTLNRPRWKMMPGALVLFQRNPKRTRRTRKPNWNLNPSPSPSPNPNLSLNRSQYLRRRTKKASGVFMLSPRSPARRMKSKRVRPSRILSLSRRSRSRSWNRIQNRAQEGGRGHLGRFNHEKEG